MLGLRFVGKLPKNYESSFKIYCLFWPIYNHHLWLTIHLICCRKIKH
jgi:hypothetical protein